MLLLPDCRKSFGDAVAKDPTALDLIQIRVEHVVNRMQDSTNTAVAQEK